MYRATGEKKYLELAAHFVDARGTDDFYARERREHPWTVWGLDPKDRKYLQCQAPVRKQKEATGHAVRAVYLYSGMADVAKETGDEALAKACRALWESVTQRRMYVTGGIGSAYEGEQFTADYHLPNDTAYSETCASVGLIFFARRMLDLEKKGEYADVMERALYNCVLAGMQLDGTRFFYVNPLEVLPGISGESPSHQKALPQRPQVVCLRMLPAQRGAADRLHRPVCLERGGRRRLLPPVRGGRTGPKRPGGRARLGGNRLSQRRPGSLPLCALKRKHAPDTGNPPPGLEPGDENPSKRCENRVRDQERLRLSFWSFYCGRPD